MKRAATLVLLLVTLSVGCGRTVHARVDAAPGIREGAPVMVSGVAVGHVEAVRVVDQG